MSRPSGQYKLLYAQVIAVSATDGFEWTATIGCAGTRDGLKKNMTVETVTVSSDA